MRGQIHLDPNFHGFGLFILRDRCLPQVGLVCRQDIGLGDVLLAIPRDFLLLLPDAPSATEDRDRGLVVERGVETRKSPAL
jgi:hypothetical protein